MSDRHDEAVETVLVVLSMMPESAVSRRHYVPTAKAIVAALDGARAFGCPHIVTDETEGTSYCGLGERSPATNPEQDLTALRHELDGCVEELAALRVRLARAEAVCVAASAWWAAGRWDGDMKPLVDAVETWRLGR